MKKLIWHENNLSLAKKCTIKKSNLRENNKSLGRKTAMKKLILPKNNASLLEGEIQEKSQSDAVVKMSI